MSVAPPAGNGTTTRTGLVGYGADVCAYAECAEMKSSAAAQQPPQKRVIMNHDRMGLALRIPEKRRTGACSSERGIRELSFYRCKPHRKTKRRALARHTFGVDL